MHAPSDIQLRGPDGEAFSLGDRWRERPLVLVFLRHFG
jgi:hypothetical protein